MRAGPKQLRAILRAISGAAVFILLMASHAAAQTAGADDLERFAHGFEYYEPWYLPSGTTKEEADGLNSRWKAIDEELKSSADEFAGDYQDGGEMHQGFLRWAPGSGFVYLYVYERFAVVNFIYGTVRVTPSEIVFTVERQQSGSGVENRTRDIPGRWVAARWRRSNYLIPARSVADFGKYVGGFGQYNDFNGPCCEFVPFLLDKARKNPQTSVDVPFMPERYARFLRRPIEATIKFVGRKRVVAGYGSEGKLYGQYYERASLTPVRIDAGRRQGVKRGLLFRLIGAPEGQYLKIGRVGASSSEGVIVRDVDDDGRETYYDFGSDAQESKKKDYPPINVGAKVTTSPVTY